VSSDQTIPNYTVLIPARLSSSRLPNKPLADLNGIPMIVRVAQRAMQSKASRVVVACDDSSIRQVCIEHGVEAVLTSQNHTSGTDRLAEACEILNLCDTEIVVNVQGDEPLIEPSVIDAVAKCLVIHPNVYMSTVAHAIDAIEEFLSPNVVKVVTNEAGLALYFSRATIPWWRDGNPQTLKALPSPPPLRHIGLYAYTVGFLKQYPSLEHSHLEELEALEQLRALSHGYSIAVHISEHNPGPGVDTPQDLERVRKILSH
jgi:3-deoxy-manno-octulosonate cytidylyltransferase (CMP-KDO synthetase)